MGSTKAAVLPVPVWAPPVRVVPLKDHGDGLCLNRGGRFIALLKHGFNNGGAKFNSSKFI